MQYVFLSLYMPFIKIFFNYSSTVCNLRACNKGHVCSKLPTENIMIVGKNDTIKSTNSDGHIFIQKKLKDSPFTVNISTGLGQSGEKYLIFGQLTDEDFKREYIASSSPSFTPFIVDPETTFTKTPRELHQRWNGFTDMGFYLATIPDTEIQGPLNVAINFGTVFQERDEAIPKLLTWCPMEKIWVDVAQTCGPSAESRIDWKQMLLEVNICSIQDYCENQNSTSSSSRKRRQVGNGLSGTQAFVVAGINTTVVNNPPYITSVSEYHIYEDPGRVHVSLSATDPEGDSLEYELNTSHVSQGWVDLTKSGLLMYKPCEDCTSSDQVHFTVIEKQSGNIPPLTTHGFVTFIITEVNDNPEIMVVNQGTKLEAINNVVNVNAENNVPAQNPYQALNILIVGFDADADDMTLYFETTRNGVFRHEKQEQTKNTSTANCSMLWTFRKETWDVELEKFYSSQEYKLPVPCNLNRSIEHNNMNWIMSSVSYTPREGFHGLDTMKVIELIYNKQQIAFIYFLILIIDFIQLLHI